MRRPAHPLLGRRGPAEDREGTVDHRFRHGAQHLLRDGLVARIYDQEMPPRVEYEISDLGRSLAPLFAGLAEWAGTNLGKVERARRAYDADRPGAA